MKFILAPTHQHALRYCEDNDINPRKATILDLSNPWYINEWRLNQREEGEKHTFTVLDNNYLETGKPVLFQDIMGYVYERENEFDLEIAEGVYFD